MAGGQSGLGIVGEAGVAFLLLGFIGGCTVRGFIDGAAPDDPMSAYDQECEQVYADANDGNAETKVETAILEQPDCMAHIATVKAERQAEQIEQVQEAQTP
jgi:hypothetical protein